MEGKKKAEKEIKKSLGDYPSFAAVSYSPDGGGMYQEGLNCREYFAAKAMQGFISSVHFMTTPDEINIIAENSVKMANALIEQLEKQQR